MKIAKHLLVFVIIAFFFSGCLDVQTTVNVNKDGSGTINEKVLFSKDMVALLSGFSKSGSADSSGNSKFSLMNVEDLKSHAPEMGGGVKFVSSKEIKEDGKEGYTAVYSFTDLSKLKISENPDNKMGMSGNGKGKKEKKDYMTFKFNPGSPAEILINMSKKDLKKKPQPKSNSKDTSKADNAFAKQFLSMMKDFRVSVKLHVNGNIENTNATYVNGSDVTLFDVSFNELFKDKDKLDKFSKMEDQDVSELKKFLKSVPGIKMELNNPVSIKFE